ncbi:glutamate receptor ionotropic, delta-2-like isoform X2 [Macrobrachium nipponense]|uniref:glutamate receptor ionotropic, delta-2-like isoform X2 n=1 Tax=Macrobrachium nipponense TaxID=159736 RepID=UPI0030C8445E
MLANREADFGLVTLALNALRLPFIDFSVFYDQGTLGIMSRAPRQKNRAMAVLSPFHFQVWVFIIVSTLLIGPVLYVMSRASFYLLKKKSEDEPGLELFAFNVFRSTINQGNSIETDDWSQRWILFVWYLFCLVNIALYSGMLTAVLAIPAFEIPVDSLYDLRGAVKDGFAIGVIKDSTNELIFKVATEGIYKEVWDLFSHKDPSQSFVDGSAEGIKRILERKFIFIGSTTVMRSYAMRLGLWNYHEGRQTFFPQLVALSFPPGAPYQENFNWVLRSSSSS